VISCLIVARQELGGPCNPRLGKNHNAALVAFVLVRVPSSIPRLISLSMVVVYLTIPAFLNQILELIARIGLSQSGSSVSHQACGFIRQVS
jgi:hypothetical protein